MSAPAAGEAGERIETLHPDPAKSGVRIPRWKYDALRRAILAAAPAAGEGVAFRDLGRRVEQALTTDELARLGSVMWHVTVVKLDLEARGELRRVAGVSPQRLLRSG